jgi:hypothetical protein
MENRMPNIRRNTILLLVIIFGGHVKAQPPHRGTDTARLPSQWRIEERLAKRSSPDLARRRVQAGKVAKHLGPTISGSYIRVVDVIDGAVNAELYLPHELFESVVRRGFIDPEWRAAYDLQRSGLPTDFWEQLEQVAASYIDDLRIERRLLEEARHADVIRKQRLESEVVAIYSETCSHRADALSRARAIFGDALDRFMYEVIAPEKITIYEEPHDLERLTFEARGCR